MADKGSWLSCEIVGQLENLVGSIDVLGPPVPRSALLPVDARLREMTELGLARVRAGGRMEQGGLGIGSPVLILPRTSQFLASRFGCSEGGR